ncbi:GTP cyclohydrolase I [Tumebacillus sp. BK434]|uniref:GTP cyclohydrolase I FolE n=1 Tax=Tumebacillus sp. BK434 TaxID=2512169 RepID=UPI00104BDEAF|nr:GTP cyclohydrolase I FolE [Tumebacillus sp. BK434]TCP59450.1 GTP cyclohydrolase I [Tumebacillus sp. BK434]
MAFDFDKAQVAVRMLLEAVGEDPNREGLLDTPKRVAKMYAEVFEGLGKNPEDELSAIFNEMHEEVVIVKDIPFFSMCEHHLVPFYGKAHVAYIPRNGQVTGLSKLARVVETVARQPQLQERITSTVADTLVNKLNPHGVAVIVEAEHMCMTMRGVKKPGASTITTSVRGIYQESSEARAEVFSLMRG